MFPKATQPILRQRLEDCFRAVGVEPQVVQDATSKHTTLALVKAGIGIALIPESSTLYAPDEVVFRQLSGELPRVNTFAVWRSDNDSPVVENFLRMVPPVNH
jgi:DNA-binding transcriptional LysR family regulator